MTSWIYTVIVQIFSDYQFLIIILAFGIFMLIGIYILRKQALKEAYKEYLELNTKVVGTGELSNNVLDKIKQHHDVDLD